MKGDFSRFTFLPDTASAVLLQQGRVLLDADFNEQALLVADAIRERTRDLVGPHAAPFGDDGFTIGVSGDTVTIAAGHYYVDGLLAVNPPPARDEGAGSPPFSFDQQVGHPDFPTALQKKPGSKKVYLVYLDVWERPVTWLERPSIREVALGAADTAMRVKVEWQVRAALVDADLDTVTRTRGFVEEWLDRTIQRHSRRAGNGLWLPRMQAWTDPKDNPDQTPCVADPLGGYSGLENQLYRVEIHSVPDSTAERQEALTFKWSRDNGSVVAAWTGRDGNELEIDGLRDTGGGFSAGQWVELTDEVGQIENKSGVMVRLVKVEPRRLTIDPGNRSIPHFPHLVNPVVRRWDSAPIRLEKDTDYRLEHGIHVRFRGTRAGDPDATYRVGDYWLIPARTATGDIEWPKQNGEAAFEDPLGVAHAYAPLAAFAEADGNMYTLRRQLRQPWQ